jgi:hypothetical protein
MAASNDAQGGITGGPRWAAARFFSGLVRPQCNTNSLAPAGSSVVALYSIITRKYYEEQSPGKSEERNCIYGRGGRFLHTAAQTNRTLDMWYP